MYDNVYVKTSLFEFGSA